MTINTGNIYPVFDDKGNLAFPQTHEDAIRTADDKTVGRKFIELNEKIDSNTTKTNKVEADMVALDEKYTEISTNTIPTMQGELDNMEKEYHDNKRLESPKKYTIEYIAHRGASSQAPENSLPAYTLASEIGFWGGECDIAQTVDGHFVLMHDDTVDRTTNGTGKVSEMTLSQIKSLVIDVGNNISNYPNLRVPTLEEFLINCKKINLVPIIEIKSATNIDSLLTIIKTLGYEDKCTVISFNENVLFALRERSSIINLQVLSLFSTTNIDKYKKYNIHIDAGWEDVTKEKVEYAHRNGMKINCWTVDNDTNRQALVEMGVDQITSNVLINNDLASNKLTNSIYEIKKNITIKRTDLKNLLTVTRGSSVYYQDMFTLAFQSNRAFSMPFYVKGKTKINVTISGTSYNTCALFFKADGYNIDESGWKTTTFEQVIRNDVETVCFYFATKDGVNFTNDTLADIRRSVIIDII